MPPVGWIRRTQPSTCARAWLARRETPHCRSSCLAWPVGPNRCAPWRWPMDGSATPMPPPAREPSRRR
jgi:hypothetical protein